MMLENEIHDALNKTDPADIHNIKRYVAWVAFRRRMHNQFYFLAHWVISPAPILEIEGQGRSIPRSKQYHWVANR